MLKLKKHSVDTIEPKIDFQPEKISPFNSFPNELLFIIFRYLRYKDRVSCRLVCRQWLNFLNNSRSFCKDELLHLHDCRFSPFESPVSTLMKSFRPFYSLKMGKISLEISNEDLSKLWQKLATTVTYLDLTELRIDEWIFEFLIIFDILKNFRQLKILKLSLCYFIVHGPKMIDHLKSHKYAESDEIQELHLTDLSGDALLFERFLQVMPKIRNLSIFSVSNFTDMQILLQMHGNIVKGVGPNVITIYHGGGNRVGEEATLKELTELAELQLETLDCGWRVDDYNVASINNFLDKQKSLKNVTFECYGDIPVDLWTNVTKLTVRFDDTITSFAKLAPLVNLKCLDFCISESYRDAEYREIHPCFFGHEKLSISSLTHLSVKTGPRKYIYMTRNKPGKTCHNCWKTMLDSFPNLESLKFGHNKYLEAIVQLILDQKALKELILINLRCQNCFLTHWKPMPQLTHLELWQSTKISVDGIANLCQKAPNLRHLRILGAHLGQPDTILKTICQTLKELEVLEVDFDSPGLTKNAFSKLYQLENLKVLGFGNHEKAQLSVARQMLLFENLPKLRTIRDIGSDSNTVSRLQFIEFVQQADKYKKLVEDESAKKSKWMKVLAFIKRRE